MGQSIHARRTKNGIRYRVFSSIVDGYLTPELTESEMREWYLNERVERARDEHAREIDSRIQRANTRGTSQLIVASITLDEPWETERCQKCGCFHHEYKPFPKGIMPKGECLECGEPKNDRGHGPACKSGGG